MKKILKQAVYTTTSSRNVEYEKVLLRTASLN